MRPANSGASPTVPVIGAAEPPAATSLGSVRRAAILAGRRRQPGLHGLGALGAFGEDLREIGLARLLVRVERLEIAIARGDREQPSTQTNTRRAHARDGSEPPSAVRSVSSA